MIIRNLIAGVAALASAGCAMEGAFSGTEAGSGVAGTERRALQGFHRVQQDGFMDVEIAVGDGYEVEVSGDDNLIPKVVTRVDGETLVVTTERGSYRSKTPLKVRITMPKLDGLRLNGAGNVRATGIESDEFLAEIRGAGSLNLSGIAGGFRVVLAGAGSVEADRFRADRATVELSGTGEARVYARESLDAKVNGVGSVRYFGNPRAVTRQVNGVGSIQPG